MTTGPGRLLAFEGLDQSGKETQARRLAARLTGQGRTVTIIAFPDRATPIGQEIEMGLRGRREFRPDVMQLLYVANRYEWKPAIADMLATGQIVICDRYLASSVAYGEAQGVDPEWLFDVQRHLPQPAVTILLDIAPATAVERKRVNRDKFESDLDLLERVRRSYLSQANGAGWHLIDGERAPDAVEHDVIAAVER